MIRALTITLFVLTPVSVVAAWVAVGPLIALALLVGLPLVAVGATVALLRRAPERAAQELAGRRDNLKAQLDA